MKLYRKDPHFYKKVFVLGFPIALQTLVTVGVGMLDNIMLSHYSQDTFSAASLAACSCCASSNAPTSSSSRSSAWDSAWGHPFWSPATTA